MQADFVLGKWLKAEEPAVLLKIDKCIDIIESFIVTGIERTMTAFNNLSIQV
jgi:peptidyl-tRNA hydrolase, PTH1 family